MGRSVLMICDTFPPQGYVGGLRPGMFSKYLPRFGWEPVALVTDVPAGDPEDSPTLVVDGLPDSARVLRVPFGTQDKKRAAARAGAMRRFRRLLRPEVSHPRGVYDKMAREANSLLRNRHFDAVWATVPNLWPIRLAAELAAWRGVPWVADLRDISEQQAGQNGALRAKLLHQRMRWRRRQLLRSAAAIVTVSNYHAAVLARHNGRNVHVIRNGFDPDMFPQHENTKRFAKFSIVYMGRILSAWLQEPRPLFAALDRMLNSGEINAEDVEISFYGTDPRKLGELAAPFQCRSLIHAEPRISYDQVPDVLRRSCMLLLLTNRGRHGILTTKLFEYMAARRPILCVPGDGGELDALIADTKGGQSCPTVESIIDVLRGWYQEWLATGSVSCNSRDEVVMRYSRKEQAGQLARILDAVVDGTADYPDAR
ncbi:MAG: glycosyltransferase [bacterium]